MTDDAAPIDITEAVRSAKAVLAAGAEAIITLPAGYFVVHGTIPSGIAIRGAGRLDTTLRMGLDQIEGSHGPNTRVEDVTLDGSDPDHG